MYLHLVFQKDCLSSSRDQVQFWRALLVFYQLELLKFELEEALGFIQLKCINGFQSEAVDLRAREETRQTIYLILQNFLFSYYILWHALYASI